MSSQRRRARAHPLTMANAEATAAARGGTLTGLPECALRDTLRRLWSEDRLTREEAARLAELGFEPDSRRANWERNFRRLARYVKRHGSIPSWRYETRDGYRLGHFVHKQKDRARKGTMHEDQRQRLRALGVPLPE